MPLEFDDNLACGTRFYKRMCCSDISRREVPLIQVRSEFASVDQGCGLAEDLSMMRQVSPCEQRHEGEDAGVRRAAK